MADILVILGIGSFYQESERAIKEFLNVAIDASEKRTIKRDIRDCFHRYRTTPQEYFLFGLRYKDKKERAKYLSDSMIMYYAANRAGRVIHDKELNNKFNFYKINEPYFKRKAILLDSSTDIEKVILFSKSLGRFIAKPNEAALGAGVKIYSVDTDERAQKVYNELKASKVPYILEELIIQDERMAVWNTSSVNTIRINSFLNNGKFTTLCPFIRTGRAGSIVDNGGQGGIFASIDKETGIICTDGMDEKGHQYICHPDSSIIYKGSIIPEWKELMELVEQVHRNMPKHVYVSWDFALSQKGWVLIEGNWGEFVCQQMTNERGFKNDFISLLNGKEI